MKKLLSILFIFPFFCNAQFVTQGNCGQYGNTFVLNNYSQEPYSGRFFNSTAINLNTDFDILFNVYMGNNLNDGLAFLFLPGAQPTTTYPASSSTFDNVHNFATGSINNDFVAEFDIRSSFCAVGQNASYEPVTDISHVAYWKNNSACSFGNYYSTYSALGTINQYAFEPYRIKWTKSTNTLETYYNNALIKSNVIDLVGTFGANVYWGFSAACYCVPGAPQVTIVTVNGQTILPLTLTSFTAENKDDKIKLSWQTSQEQNTSHFDVEKSTDGINFYLLKQIVAAGNSNIIRDYATIDASALYGSNFYRIKSVDLDAKYSYSKTVAIKLNDKKPGISIFPNPVDKELRIQLSIPSKEKASLRILDVAGRVLKTETIQLNDATVAFTMNVTTLQPGIYQLQLNYGGEKITKQFVKAN